jgi:hypothetical protein
MMKKLPPAASAALIVAGLSITALPAFAFLNHIGICHDVRAQQIEVAHVSMSRALPFPVVESCTGAAPFVATYYIGFLIAALGCLSLLFGNASRRLIAVTAALAILLAAAVPYLTTTDPYSYAMYAYDIAVLHASPYAAPYAPGPVAAGHVFLRLFPDVVSPIRMPVYGPLFMALYGLIIGPVSSLSIGAMIVAERLLAAAGVIALGLLLASFQESEIRRKQTFIAVSLNPVLLFEGVVSAHGDVFMLLALAFAYACYCRGRIAACALACVCALEFRIVGVLALLALIRELIYTGRRRDLWIAAGTGGFAIAVITILSSRLFPGMRVGGVALFASNYDAPATILVSAIAGSSLAALVTGAVIQMACAGAMAYCALRERIYSLLPVAALVALPIVNPWYAQWLGPVAATTSNVPYRAALAAFMLLAPLQAFTVMLPLADISSARMTSVLVQWLVPIAVFAITSSLQRRRVAHTFQAAAV